jgi:hypothetical protein
MQEATLLVSYLNTEFYEKTDNTEWTPFAFDTDGTDYRITFLGFPVFSTAADYVKMDQTLKEVIMAEVELMMKDLKQWDKERHKS